jgi:phospholipid-binding lipoprotein MlaA
MTNPNRLFHGILLSILLVLLSGCATVQQPNEDDPFESFNRTMYDFNRGVDKAVLRPIAKGYDAVAPAPVKQSVSNFFANLDELPNFVNSLLQGKVVDGFSDLGRFTINSTLGLGGLFDVASKMGIPSHDEDFGQTLGVWGIESGPYLVLPFLGPSSIRDSVSRPADNLVSVQNDMNHIPTRNTLYFMNLVDLRYRLLPLDSQLDEAVDEYSFVRDAYLMRRQFLVYDGSPPEPDDLYDDECLGGDDEFCDDEILD